MQARDYRTSQDSNGTPGVLDANADFRFTLLEALVERLTQQGIEIYDAEELSASIERVEEENGRNAGNNRPGGGQARLIYRSAETLDDDKAEFSLQAQVTTLDGRELDMDVEITLPYIMIQASAVEIRAGNAHLAAPLQVAYQGQGAELERKAFSFDIELVDADRATGSRDVDDFDALYGDELGYDYDELHEGEPDERAFMDDDEEVYGRLRVWTKDEQDHEYLFALGEMGAEAIYLGHVQDPQQLVTEREVVSGQLDGDGYYFDDDDTDLFAAYDLSA